MLQRIRLIFGGPALALFGVVLIYWGNSERDLADTASAEPEVIRLADLIARGPQGNSHIVLTEFDLCEDIVYQEKEKTNTWDKVWIPIVPKAAAPAAPNGKAKPRPADVQRAPRTAISAILLSQHVASEDEIASKLGNQPKLQGMVTNLIDKLGYKERKLLEEGYPGTDFSKCIIFEEGRTPAGSTKVFALWGGGVALILIGLGCFIYGFMPRRTALAPAESIAEVKPAGP